MQYLSEWRLRLATDALVSSDRAIKKIADDAGFGSTAAFSRAFKREMGMSPGKWRRSGHAGRFRARWRRQTPHIAVAVPRRSVGRWGKTDCPAHPVFDNSERNDDTFGACWIALKIDPLFAFSLTTLPREIGRYKC